jgi:hypothetical protein
MKLMGNSRMKDARAIGLLICDRISKKGLEFIEDIDPDLHYDIIQELKKRSRKT